jgi:hypothetical protein
MDKNCLKVNSPLKLMHIISVTSQLPESNKKGNKIKDEKKEYFP